jgi:hypothetical protein
MRSTLSHRPKFKGQSNKLSAVGEEDERETMNQEFRLTSVDVME